MALVFSESTTRAFDWFKIILLIVGITANVIILVTLIFNGKPFFPSTRALLRHQSITDAWICLMTILILVDQSFWTTGNADLDMVICHVWHSQGAYWMAMSVSIWNLVMLSYDRYLAVSILSHLIMWACEWSLLLCSKLCCYFGCNI